jgi:hypothetical protein
MIDAVHNRVSAAKFERMDVRELIISTPVESFDGITVYFSLIDDVTPDEIRQFMTFTRCSSLAVIV